MDFRKKLIEVALPLEDINREASRSKRKAPAGYPTTIHKWWAQRPLSACRAVLFASLVDDPLARPDLFPTEEAQTQERERLFQLIRELVKWENSNDPRILAAAKAEIVRSCGKSLPLVYDPFCGGGSIPLEAQRLGLETYASDLNPVPTLITKALVELPPRWSNCPPINPASRQSFDVSGTWRAASGLAADVRYYGTWLRDEAKKQIGHLYPSVKANDKRTDVEVVAWLWARTIECPNPACRAQMPLMRTFWLSKKKDRQVYAHAHLDHVRKVVRFEPCSTGQPPKHTTDRKGARCLFCERFIKKSELRSLCVSNGMQIVPVALVVESDSGRAYLPSDTTYRTDISAPNAGFLDQEITNDRRWFSPPLYGLRTFKDLFTPRQLASHRAFQGLLTSVRAQIVRDINASKVVHISAHAENYADTIIVYLALALNRCIDYGNTICSWRAKDNAMRSGFSMQAIPMVWDFAEGNPFASSSSGFTDCVRVVARCLEFTPATTSPGHVRLRDAATKTDGSYVYSTDPPYYANIGYADLSDFFYLWLRESLKEVLPDIFSTVMVPKREELVAVPIRHGGDKAKAQAFFENALGRAFSAIRTTAHPDFPITVYYAFKQTEDSEDEESEDSEEFNDMTAVSTGWETMLSGLIGAGFCIDGTWPMRTEGDNRRVGINTNALASSIVLVCRPRPADAGPVSRRDFLSTLKQELPDALRHLQKGNIAPVDLAQAAIGPGMAVFSRYTRVLETDGSPMGVRTALALINQSLDEVLAEQEGEFDADTRWALAWFDQYGFTEGPYGAAETLCTAKNTSVSGMTEAGILTAKGGKVRLLQSGEFAANWNPAEDARLTIWEIVHQLIRVLGSGEQSAADLLHRVQVISRGKAEIARDLAYRLFGLSERRKRAADALSYNALVISWPEIARLAAESTTKRGPTQTELL